MSGTGPDAPEEGSAELAEFPDEFSGSRSAESRATSEPQLKSAGPRLISVCRGVPGRLEQMTRSSAEIAEIHPSGLDRGREPFGEFECFVDDECLRGSFLSPVCQDGALGASRDDGICDPFNPDAGASTLPAVFTTDRFEGEDLVCPRVLPEAEEHHAGVGGHWPSMGRPAVQTWREDFAAPRHWAPATGLRATGPRATGLRATPQRACLGSQSWA